MARDRSRATFLMFWLSILLPLHILEPHKHRVFVGVRLPLPLSIKKP